MLLKQLSDTLLPILEQPKTVGLFISGGFDSAVLFYICCMIKQKHNLPCVFKVYTVPRYDDSTTHSKNIVDYISQVFNINFNIEIVGNPNLYHSKQVLSGLLIAKDMCDAILIADTTNPDELPNGPERQKANNPKFIQPMFNWTKKDTVALAIELGLLDLMELSHTCTESKTTRCSVCWQCRERVWAFAENNYPDPGTM